MSEPRKAKGSAFLFDVAAYRGSRPVQRMTYDQRGRYLEMMCEQWDKGSLPDDPVACAALFGDAPDEWITAWPILRRNFVDRRAKPRHGSAELPLPTDHDASRRIVNLRLERTRRERRAYLRHMADLGKKGGHGKAKKGDDLQASARLADAQRTSTYGLDRKGLDRKGLEGIGGDRKGSAGITHEGPRLRIPHWQHEDLGRRLGGKAETFDLLGWYARLEAELERTGEAFADPWKWLQERLYRDAELPLPNLMGRPGKTASNPGAAGRFIARGMA